MCGLVGFYSPLGFSEIESTDVALRMRDRLIHRGPDSAGLWIDAEVGIALAHRRLSILDLTAAGNQPMISSSGRYVLVFNGEIYNHQALRATVESAGHCCEWRGHSDTETLLAAIEAMGLQNALRESVGMFAVALWDKETRSISLARDRMGEKPLYYGWQRGTFLFGSELKALREHPNFRSEIDKNTLPLYLKHGYIPAPWSIWSGIRKLLPGSIVRITSSQNGVLPEPVAYWALEDVVTRGLANPFVGTDGDAIDALETQIKRSVGDQMIADVPLGAFLSGGVDSSVVVAIMQSLTSKRVKTFTIGFHEDQYSEAAHAKAVALYLGTDHTELYVSAAQAHDVIPGLPKMFDEPFGDSSAIPTYLVSKLASESVAVSLSGDGGDELFGGYGRYYSNKARSLQRVSQRLPLSLKKGISSVLRAPLIRSLEGSIKSNRREAADDFGSSFAAKCDQVACLLDCASAPDYYIARTSQWNSPPLINAGQLGYVYGLQDRVLRQVTEPINQMMAIDTASFLPDDILAKIDRAAMASGLETRVPLLDHRIVDLAWRMPIGMKAREGQGKWLLRQVLYRYVPHSLIDRPKMGFGVPVDIWLRGPLRDWAEELLSEQSLKRDGLLDPRIIRDRWNQHTSGQHNWKDSLWLVLMFQSWMAGCRS